METKEQVNALRGAVKYRPLKGKRLSDVLEGKQELSKLEELIGVPDVDAVFIGPHDLSVNVGYPEDYDSIPFSQGVEEIIKVCRENKIGVANHFSYDI